MRWCFRSFFALLLVAATACAQTPGQAPDQAPYTLSTTVRLVITDVSVTDSSGHAVHGLKQSDFSLFEDKKPQRIRSFDEQQPAVGSGATPNLPQGVYSNVAVGQLPNTTNVLLIDAFNTDVTEQMYLRIQLMRAVRGFDGKSAVAVFAINSGHAAVLLQSFTSDPALLKAAVARELPRLVNNGGNQVEHFQDALGAIGTISNYLSRIPGHKNLLWFSNYFPFTEQRPGFIDGFDDQDRQRLVHIYNQLSLDRVAVYPIDVKGPETTEAPQVNQQTAMDQLAKATGGAAYYSRNDLGRVAVDAVAGGSDYYTLTYAPKDFVADNKFHAIHVDVAGGPYTLRYRSGYVAFDMKDDASQTLSGQRLSETNADLDQLASGGKLARSKNKSAEDSLTDYNTPGPAAATILFEARIVPAAQVPGWQVLPQARDVRGKLIGNAHDVPYVIEYAALSKDLRFVPTPGGKQHAELIAAAMAYTDGGEIVSTALDRVQLNFSEDQMQIANRTGTPLRQQIRLPRGSVFVSLALIDNITGRTGSLEIPFTAAKP